MDRYLVLSSDDKSCNSNSASHFTVRLQSGIYSLANYEIALTQLICLGLKPNNKSVVYVTCNLVESEQCTLPLLHVTTVRELERKRSEITQPRYLPLLRTHIQDISLSLLTSSLEAVEFQSDQGQTVAVLHLRPRHDAAMSRAGC
jgi:hypothetical protein